DDQAAAGPLAVSSDGTAYLTLGTHVKPVGAAYGRSTVILSIDTAGNPQKVADVTADTGYTGPIEGFVLDAADHLDLLHDDTSQGVLGGIVTSYARDGSMVFSSAFPCDAGYLGPLAAGSSFVVMQFVRPCGMGLTGSPAYSEPHNYDSLALTLDAA